MVIRSGGGGYGAVRRIPCRKQLPLCKEHNEAVMMIEYLILKEMEGFGSAGREEPNEMHESSGF